MLEFESHLEVDFELSHDLDDLGMAVTVVINGLFAFDISKKVVALCKSEAADVGRGCVCRARVFVSARVRESVGARVCVRMRVLACSRVGGDVCALLHTIYCE